MRLKRLLRGEFGGAIVEFALVVPLFFTLVWGTIMLSRAYTRLNALNTSLREGARMLAADQYADSVRIQNLAKARMYNFSSAFGFPIDTSRVVITFTVGSPNVSVSVTNYPLFTGLFFIGNLQTINVSRTVLFRHEWAS